MKKVKKKSGLQIPQANIGIGYKVFKNDWRCKDFQYKVGEVFEHSGPLTVCNSGFHFCESLIDCFNYYDWNPENKVAVVHFDKTKTIKENGGDKSCTSLIFISHEIKWEEVMVMCNHGDRNTGHRNTGDSNTGHWNTGHSNTGHSNTGDRNTGDRNTGHSNTGHWNTGHRNTGDRNTGHRNTGHRNTGDRNTGHSNTGDSNTGHWNTGDRNTGFMNTDEPKMRIFNVQTELTFNECSCFRWFSVLMAVNPVTVRYWNEMNEKEQADNPKAKVTGYLVESTTMKEAYAKWWNGLKAADKKEMESIPNFNKTLFKELTGIEYDP